MIKIVMYLGIKTISKIAIASDIIQHLPKEICNLLIISLISHYPRPHRIYPFKFRYLINSTAALYVSVVTSWTQPAWMQVCGVYSPRSADGMWSNGYPRVIAVSRSMLAAEQWRCYKTDPFPRKINIRHFTYLPSFFLCDFHITL